ncbi:oxygen-insensitive NADPH nitroreductase [Priestia taiwanensis]|uniref:NADPH-dependent oxidoreductase n=1 Tax=Priestia taiwanensis TaxID=1347902 RepID=A0A917AWN1_9BACI|nr:oxygen-insensitive NADPH nitroreductase [Priestia taiwanensis]MBM7364441.1 nitroreductase [Priestia taiwanensis]GGE81421.1 NADPH-dependent oxidoreductase [Priestia taiwanensis]
MNETINLMMNHASVRKYKEEMIPKETVEKIVYAAQHAASSNFVQAYSIIHVTDQALKEKLAELSGNKHVSTCGAFLLCCADFKRLAHAATMHDKELVADTMESLLVTTIDVTLLSQNIALAAESLGYGICYIGGVRNNPQQISQLVNLPDRVVPLFGMTIGVPDEEQLVKPRLPVSAVLHENTYDGEQYTQTLPAYDETMREYYKTRLTNQKDMTWTGSMADFLSVERRMYLQEVLEERGLLRKQ